MTDHDYDTPTMAIKVRRVELTDCLTLWSRPGNVTFTWPTDKLAELLPSPNPRHVHFRLVDGLTVIAKLKGVQGASLMDQLLRRYFRSQTG